MFCPSCGKPATEDSKFCPDCGRPLLRGATPVPTPLPPPQEPPGEPARSTFSGGATLAGPGPAVGCPALEPGQTFHERYRIERILGQGGMGVVYQARDQVTEDVVCLKVILPSLVHSEALSKRFLREGKLARDLRHPNIVAIYDVNSAAGTYYISMEYLEGTILRKWILENLRAKREVPLATACRILREILKGLAAAHEAGVIHRDLKPENIMLLGDPARDGLRAKILDFGIARALHSGEQLTVSGAAMGTPVYMAPEQETGAEAAGPEADLYSAAVILYEILLGIAPRGRWELPGRVRAGVPPALDAFVEKALHTHPSRRFQSAAQFLAALDGAVQAPGGTGPKVQGEIPREPAGGLLSGGSLKDLLGGDARKRLQSPMPWPWSRWQWIACNAMPCLAWSPWLILSIRARSIKHFAIAVVYSFPCICTMVLTEMLDYMPTDDEEVLGLGMVIACFWIAAIIHALKSWTGVVALNEKSLGREAPR